MRRLAVDLSQSSCAVAEEPRRLTDFQTKQPKVNPETGEALSSLKVLISSPSEMSIITVTLPASGVPDKLMINDQISLVGLMATPSVDRANRSVVYFDAQRVELASVAKPKAA